MKKNNKKESVIIRRILFLLILVVLLIGSSFAWYTVTLTGTKNNILKAGTLSLELDDQTAEGINLEKIIPVSDEEGMTYVPYSFTLKNNGNIDSEYSIYLDDVEIEEGKDRVEDKFIKYGIIEDNETPTIALLSTTGQNPNRVIASGTITPNQTISYELRIWLDYDATNEAMDTIFKAKIRIEATQIKKQ